VFLELSKTEGIIPESESSDVMAYLMNNSKVLKKNDNAVVIVSKRGNKNLQIVH
jgi:tryptophan synthase beta subunit